MQRSIGILLVFGIVAVVLVFLAIAFGLAAPARAHIDGRHDLDAWTNGLKNKQGGQCCDSFEAKTVEDPDYEGNPSGGYRVKLDGQWLNVPEDRVIQGPNKYGPALVWPYKDLSGEMHIRCFLPGSGS